MHHISGISYKTRDLLTFQLFLGFRFSIYCIFDFRDLEFLELWNFGNFGTLRTKKRDLDDLLKIVNFEVSRLFIPPTAWAFRQ
jgi:hypothetical protein